MRNALWPGGIMGPPRVPPTTEEAQEIRISAEEAALSALPGILLCQLYLIRLSPETVIGDISVTTKR
jgi:hypothetical protein